MSILVFSYVRFAKTAGCSGWSSFIKDFIDEVKFLKFHSGRVDANFRFACAHTLRQVAGPIQTLKTESMIQTRAESIEAELAEFESWMNADQSGINCPALQQAV